MRLAEKNIRSGSGVASCYFYPVPVAIRTPGAEILPPGSSLFSRAPPGGTGGGRPSPIAHAPAQRKHRGLSSRKGRLISWIGAYRDVLAPSRCLPGQIDLFCFTRHDAFAMVDFWRYMTAVVTAGNRLSYPPFLLGCPACFLDHISNNPFLFLFPLSLFPLSNNYP